ncbi:RICIN domain-containing protein [Winogradskyella helgolandensis]|uniref:RICIN domain-containing protein n=1 Tax=Winogradskyella helgolandensis TaxID=2697010 RepID=UPI0015C0D1D1|nr:RICIN domain-containing protein [Winogradskyella helgolandensis]
MNFFSIKKSKISILFFGLSIFTILGVSPYFFGPGLTQPESVGTFLNGNFPDVTASANPYQPAFPNLTFNSPLTFTTVPNSNVLIIGQQNGEIYSFENDNAVTTKNLVADLSNEVGVVWDGGFLGLEIHPEFGTPGKNYIYTYYTSKDENGNDYPNAFVSGFGCYKEDYWGGFSYLRRYEVDPITFTVVPGSELTMIKIRMFSSSHRGGALEFGDDGFLYLTTGEQSAYTKSQNITTNLDGGVLRLDVDQDPTKSHNPIRTLNTGRFNDEISGVGYGIPNDNPFLSPLGDNFEEYYTIGHRNPHRMSKDALTGTMYIGEVGAGTHEEVNILSKGKNYGWPIYEGNVAGPGVNCGAPDDGMYNNMAHEGPLVAFPRAEANALMGGFVYRGTAMPEYYGKYICADYGTGEEIWVVDISTGTYELITAFSPTNIISFGEDNQGELYLLSQGNNVSLYKMTQVNGSPLDNVPELLSETGAFQDLATLTPNSGVLPYELVESFWSDGAEKKRWMVIPNDGTHDTPDEKISFSEDGDWEFPVGSVLIKHFELPIDDSNPNITKRLETRFSIKASTGDFYFLTYKWNANQTDAVLLESGLDENIEITTTSGTPRYQTWTYPSTQDCIACHNPATNGSIGPRTRFLNSNITYPQTSVNANQLVTLSHLGILDETIDDNTVLGYQTHKAIDDPIASLDERARSYLDNNCAYCHRPGGTGERAQFDLRLSNSLVDTGLMYAGTNEPVDGLNRIVIAGDAENSILFHRIESVDQTVAMPPVAKNEVDQAGVDLIEAWIDQLDPNYEDPTIDACTYTITNVGSGLVMDIAGLSQANGANVQQWTFIAGGNQLNQQFMVEPNGNGYYTIKAVHSDKNLDVQGAGQASGTNVIQYQGNGTDAQLYSFEFLGNNQYAIKSKTNNLYLGIENSSLNNGGSIKTYVDDGSDFFKWTFTALEVPVTGVSLLEESAIVSTGENIALTASVLPINACDQNILWSSSDEAIALVDTTGNVTGVAEGIATITATTVDGGFTDSTLIEVYDNVAISTSIYTITNVGSSLVMDIANQSQANFTDVIQEPGTLSNNQKFIVTPDGNGYYTIKAVHSNKNIDVQGGGQISGTNLIQYNDNGTNAQLFSLIYLGNDMYAIQSKVNNLYAGIENNSLANGASIKTYPNDGTDFFKWEFTDLSTTYTFDDNTGWFPSNPMGVSTLYDEIIVESGNAIISSNTTCDTIIVNPGAALTINNGVTLTTSTTTLKSTSQSYSSLIVDGTIEGTVKYERYVNANSGGNDLISPPLSGETWENFLLSDDNATDILNDGNNNPRTYLFGPFDKTSDSYLTYTDAVSATLNSGVGYRAGTVSGTNLTFTGTVPTAAVTVDIRNTGATYADWNLVGNPYPSYLDMELFLSHVLDNGTNPATTNLSILENVSGIYGYDGDASDGWSVITLANASEKLMAPGQGFFVAANAAYQDTHDITFDPSMRTIGNDDDFIAGRSSEVLTFLKLNASTDANSYGTEFYFNTNASRGVDLGYDGKILGNIAPNFAIYSHLVEDNTGLPMALQALNPTDLENTIIPLGVNANQGEQLTFSISETTLPSEVEVYLEDNVTNTVTLLNSGDYTLTPNTDLNGTGRFYLRFSSTVLSVEDNDFDTLQIYTTTNPKTLVVKGVLNDATKVNLYDIHGRIVLKQPINHLDIINTIDVSRIGTGVYFVKVFNASQVKTQKLIIR